MMITTEYIKSILESAEFRVELDALSCYGANIRQERPIVLFLAKYFWQRGHKVALEKNKCDLVVDGIRIECKFHFDSDTPRLQKELTKYDGSIEMLMNAVSAKKHSKTWTVCPGIYRDVVVKRPDIFVWVLCARDLTKLTKDEMSRVCVGDHQRRYNKNNPYELNRAFLEVADGFLDKLNELRNFSLEQATVTTTGAFPSAYHLMLFTFADT